MIREASQPTGMTAMLGRYPEYRDSGVPWIEDCPSYQNWRIDRLKNVARVRLSNVDKLAQDGELPVLLCNYVNVYKNDFISPKIQFVKATATHQEVREFGLRAGDVLITKDSESWDDIGVPAVVTVDMPDVLCGYHLAIVRPDSNLLIGEFLMRALGAPEIAAQFHVAANGITRFGLSLGDITSIRVPLPPLDEQSAIVKYLAHVDRKIDRFIRARRRMIELLNEQKQAIVHQAVTKGLDPSVPMKDSGVEWLGEIPAHWEVRRNGGLFSLVKQTGFPDLPILEVSLRTGVKIRALSDSKRKQFMSDMAAYQRALAGDLAYNMMRMWQGAVGVVPVDGLVSPAYVVIRPNSGQCGKYYELLFRTPEYQAEVDNYSRGIVKDRNRLYWDQFKSMPSACPPSWEQEQIVEEIDKRTNATNRSIERMGTEIDLLREYRTRLISDVVTGKIDVRAIAATLDDIDPTAEPLDLLDGDAPVDDDGDELEPFEEDE